MSREYRDDFVNGLGFGLDGFQHAAFDAVERGVNVLVSAPTGSGKTIVATFAIGRRIEQGQRAFYTTPLKALSNQKYHELAERFGTERVGLLTGDTSINRGADVVVMTTEVLRNMLLTDSLQLRDLAVVVLDEVHYLQDPYRGGVWEEVLILTPPPVQFVALSATVGNAPFVGEWLNSIRGTTEVIVESHRPISLRNHVSVVRRGQNSAELLELLTDHQLSDSARRIDNLMKSSRRFRPGPKWRGPTTGAPPPPFRAPRRSELLRSLEVADLLPVIVFIFSRAACDDAVNQCRRDGLRFTTAEQRTDIESIAHLRLARFSNDELRALEYDDFLDSLVRGLAAHHAGMIPAFREIVEACFERNLLGVVFATETLALGINMPARTVALERFSKFSDAGRSFLTSAEYAQMTGRAGRRGLDDEGHAIICFNPEVAMRDVARIAIAPPADLHSSFRPTYNFTANLIDHFDLETAVTVVERSFAQFEAAARPAASRRSLSDVMLARHRVLEALGYAEGWRLTDDGQLLRSLYHESDLLVAEALREGLLDDLDSASLAGFVSCFVFERKRPRQTPHAAKSVTTKKRRTIPDRVGRERRLSLEDRLRSLSVRVAAVREIESRNQLSHGRDPDGSFAHVITAWARGATLATVLDLADVEVGQTSPGDFVRAAKQVADLCEQLARLRSLGPVAERAADARDAIVRSVVATATMVHPLRQSEP